MFNLEVIIYNFFVQLSYLFRTKIKPGQTIILLGGHELEPHWLGDDKGKKATVLNFMPGQYKKGLDLLVKFDQPFEVDNYKAVFAVLSLRFEGAKWFDGETCHIEICDFLPENKAWEDRIQGKWVESHATIRSAK